MSEFIIAVMLWRSGEQFLVLDCSGVLGDESILQAGASDGRAGAGKARGLTLSDDGEVSGIFPSSLALRAVGVGAHCWVSEGVRE